MSAPEARTRPRRLGRPPAVDSTVTRSRILTAARRSFATRGYDATTNRDIADEAGVTTGALYHYTRSKADLYGEVYAQVQDLVYGEFEKAFALDTFRQRFGAVLDAAVALNRRDPSLAGFVIGVSPEVQRHPELRDRLRSMAGRTSAFLQRLVADAVVRGELAPDVDPAAVEDLLNAVLGGLARFSNLPGDADRHAAAADVLHRLVDGTLVVEPSRP
jgi:AcrR family transcriptional regulator